MSKHTDQKLLVQGLKKLALSLPLLFLSPYVLTLSFLNKETYVFYIFFSIGIILGILAVYLVFKGISTVMKSIF